MSLQRMLHDPSFAEDVRQFLDDALAKNERHLSIARLQEVFGFDFTEAVFVVATSGPYEPPPPPGPAPKMVHKELLADPEFVKKLITFMAPWEKLGRAEESQLALEQHFGLNFDDTFHIHRFYMQKLRLSTEIGGDSQIERGP